MNRFTVFQELRVPQQTNLAFVTHVKTGFYVGFPVKKKKKSEMGHNTCSLNQSVCLLREQIVHM